MQLDSLISPVRYVVSNVAFIYWPQTETRIERAVEKQDAHTNQEALWQNLRQPSSNLGHIPLAHYISGQSKKSIVFTSSLCAIIALIQKFCCMSTDTQLV